MVPYTICSNHIGSHVGSHRLMSAPQLVASMSLPAKPISDPMRKHRNTHRTRCWLRPDRCRPNGRSERNTTDPILAPGWTMSDPSGHLRIKNRTQYRHWPNRCRTRRGRGERIDEEADFDVRSAVSTPKPHQIDENLTFRSKSFATIFFQHRKIAICKSSETRVAEVSRRSEPSSRGQRTFEVRRRCCSSDKKFEK